MENARRLEFPLFSGAVALACVALSFAPGWLTASLAYDRIEICSGEIWRLWTGHLVHFSVAHALADSAAFVLLGALAEQEVGAKRLSFGLAFGAPFIAVGLMLAAPDLLYYRGASGVATMAAVVAGISLWQTHPARRLLLALLAAAFGAATACQALGIDTGLSTLPRCVAEAWQAHLFGALAGVVMALPIGVRSHIHTRADPQTVPPRAPG